MTERLSPASVAAPDLLPPGSGTSRGLPGASASPKEHFDLLHTALGDYHARLVDSALKVTASLVVVIGWLITSEGAARLFSENLVARAIATIGLMTAAYIYCSITLRVQSASKRVGEQLDTLRYMDHEFYSDRVLTQRTVRIYMFSNVLLNGFAATLVWLIQPSARP